MSKTFPVPARGSHAPCRIPSPCRRIFLTGLACLFLAATASAQGKPKTGQKKPIPPESIVRVEAEAFESPPRIRLIFHDPGRFTIYRKELAGATDWGRPIATTRPNAKDWTDKKVRTGQAYEYLIREASDKPTFQLGTHLLKRAYLAAGIAVDRTGPRGKIIIVQEEALAKELDKELGQFHRDLVGDGWEVLVLTAPRGGNNDSRAAVKLRGQIRALYKKDPKNTKQVLLLGHVPQPRSGLQGIMPDGHTAGGAYPTDSFYADVDGAWPDKGTFSGKGPPNKPGDGKFDPVRVPSPVEMGFGRVDTENLTRAQPRTEIDLMRNYLDKEHRYRHAAKDFRPGRTCVLRLGHSHVNDHANQAFPAIVGAKNTRVIEKKDLSKFPKEEKRDGDIAYANQNGPLLFYAKGSGVPSSKEAAANGCKFVCLFGWQSSWGYWHKGNNFMRMALGAEGYTLAVFWMTRIRYPLHVLAMGETFGDFQRRTVNNFPLGPKSQYVFPLQPRNAGRKLDGRVTLNLIGNPALRLFPVPPPTEGAAERTGRTVKLRWKASEDKTLLGYHIYRAKDEMGPYRRLTDSGKLITPAEYVDTNAPQGEPYYMVRAVKLETTGGGSFLNPSQGLFLRAPK